MASNPRNRAARIGCTVDELESHEAAGSAWCGGCRRWRDEVDDFAGNMSRPSGRQVYCRECQAEKQRAWRSKRAA